MKEKLYSRYLLDEHPVTFHTSLAVAIGVNEAIILQKINLWLNCRPKDADGRSWIYNSYKSWQEQLPFFSESTIRRTISNLVKIGVIIKGNFNKTKFDKTTWYSIDYEKLDKIIEDKVTSIDTNEQNNECKIDTSMCSNWTHGEVQNEQTNTNEYTMNIKKEKKESEIDLIIKERIQDEDLKNVIYDFIKMRKTIKRPMTTRAVNMLIDKLNKFSNNVKEQQLILDKSIMNCWQDIYQLKDDEKIKIEKENCKNNNQIQYTYDYNNLSTQEYGELLKLRHMNENEYKKRFNDYLQNGKIKKEKIVL